VVCVGGWVDRSCTYLEEREEWWMRVMVLGMIWVCGVVGCGSQKGGLSIVWKGVIRVLDFRCGRRKGVRHGVGKNETWIMGDLGLEISA